MTASPPPDDLAAFLERQRWFAAKDRAFTVTDVELLATVRESRSSSSGSSRRGGRRLGAVPPGRRAPTRRLSRLEHVHIGQHDGEALYDALHDREVTDDWLALLRGDLVVRRARGAAGPAPSRLPEGGPSLVMTAEQSNTSLVYGDTHRAQGLPPPAPGPAPRRRGARGARRGRAARTSRRRYGWIDSPAGHLRLRPGVPRRRGRGLGPGEELGARPAPRGRPARRRGRRRLRRRGRTAGRGDRRGARGAARVAAHRRLGSRRAGRARRPAARPPRRCRRGRARPGAVRQGRSPAPTTTSRRSRCRCPCSGSTATCTSPRRCG